MVKLNEILTDWESAESGRWFTWRHGVRARIRSSQCPSYIEKRRKATQAYDGPPLDIDATIMLLRPAMAEELVLDITGIDDDDGNPVPFSKDLASELIHGSASFMWFVANAAGDADNWTKAATEKALGESSRSSAGSESTESLVSSAPT